MLVRAQAASNFKGTLSDKMRNFFMQEDTHLQHVVSGFEELNKTRNNSTFDNTLDGWVFLFGQQLAELGGRVKLALTIVGEHIAHHLIGLLEIIWVKTASHNTKSH